MPTASIGRLSHRTSEVIADAEKFGQIVVTRDGMPVAAVVPLSRQEAEAYMLSLLEPREA